MSTWKYTAHAYANRGSTYTGWVKADNGKASFKFIKRSGYQTADAALKYATKWADKLNKSDPLGKKKRREKTPIPF